MLCVFSQSQNSVQIIQARETTLHPLYKAMLIPKRGKFKRKQKIKLLLHDFHIKGLATRQSVDRY